MADEAERLTVEESTLLKLMFEGESIADLGEYSRWSAPLQGLVAKGYAQKLDQHNHVITPAGREMAIKADDAEMRSVISLNNAIHAQRTSEVAVQTILEEKAKEIAIYIKHALPEGRWRAGERAFIDEFTSQMASR